MKTSMMRVLGALAAGSFAVLAAPASAQTTANGPYYATPSWAQKLPCDTASTCPRFVVLANWSNEAVLDRETGIVWEREPNVFPFEARQAWGGAIAGCVQKNVGGRKGWRLPMVDELNSLLDGATNRLPAGHPFINVKTGTFQVYWSATRFPGSPEFAFTVGFGGSAGSEVVGNPNFYWCMRAPGGPVY